MYPETKADPEDERFFQAPDAKPASRANHGQKKSSITAQSAQQPQKDFFGYGEGQILGNYELTHPQESEGTSKTTRTVVTKVETVQKSAFD